MLSIREIWKVFDYYDQRVKTEYNVYIEESIACGNRNWFAVFNGILLLLVFNWRRDVTRRRNIRILLKIYKSTTMDKYTLS